MRARALRGLALVAVLGAGAGCNAVLGIEALEAEEGAGGAGGAAEAGGGAGGGGGGGHAGDASVEGGGGSGGAAGVDGSQDGEAGGGGSGGGAGDAASEQAGGSGGGGGAAADAGDAGGSGGGGGCTGTTCSLPNAASAACVAGVCKVVQCVLHYDDCDADPSNGCEASLYTDPLSCGGCGNECSAKNGTPSCVSGACKIACSVGFSDCDGDVANGCERTITDDVANCGACNAACTVANGTPQCTGATCGVGTCAGGWADCDGQYGNGCETSTDANVANCGACGVKCATGVVCVSGKCTPSCAGGATGQSDCGPSSNESCCASLLVPGGTVQLDPTHTATVSDYKLDKYEITVGRFRAFVDAVVGGWVPGAGSGKHTHLNGGQGLSNGAGGYEPGWDTAWNTNLPTAKATWDGSLSCSSKETWTSAAGSNERLPINCIEWYQAEAFCIWDGGFLPSEAEWQYAAAGGSENRKYPWSVPPSNTTIDCSYANFYNGTYCVNPPNGSTNNVGSESPKGNGKWGQSDLAGNVWEWALDWYASYSTTSANYANTLPSSNRVIRGGGFNGNASNLLASTRSSNAPANRDYDVGARCARTP